MPNDEPDLDLKRKQAELAKAQNEQKASEEALAEAVAKRKQAEAEQRKAETEANAAARDAALDDDREVAEARKRAKVAEYEKSEAEADKARREADIESDPDVVNARTRAKVSDFAKQQAEADKTARKAAVPDAPTLASIGAEADKSPTVEDSAGKATAALVAASALDTTGAEIGNAVWQALAAGNRSNATIWLVDGLGLAEREIGRLALEARLTEYIGVFTPPQLPSEPPTTGDTGAAHLEFALEGLTAARSLSLLGNPEWLSYGMTVGTGLAKFGVELVGALRSRYHLYGRDIELNRTSLQAAALRSILADERAVPRGIKVRWPSFATVASSPLVAKFAEACRARDAFFAKEVAPGIDDSDKAAKAKQAWAKALVDSFDTYATAILAVPSGGTTSPLVAAALLDAIVPHGTGSDSALLLEIDIATKGADAMTGYGLVKGTTAAFLGFVQAYYVLAETTGEVVAAGSVTNSKAGRLEMQKAELKLGETGNFQ